MRSGSTARRRRAHVRGPEARGGGRRAALRGARRCGAALRGRRAAGAQARGLDAAAAEALLAERVPSTLSHVVRDRLVESTAGNPLALIELAEPAERGPARRTAPLPDPLPRSAEIERIYLERARRLRRRRSAAPARRGRRHRQPGHRASRRPRRSASSRTHSMRRRRRAWCAPRRAGRVRHPLVRSTLYADATFAQRQAVHRALADVLDGEQDADRRAWHRAAASAGRGRRGRRRARADRAAGAAKERVRRCRAARSSAPPSCRATTRPAAAASSPPPRMRGSPGVPARRSRCSTALADRFPTSRVHADEHAPARHDRAAVRRARGGRDDPRRRGRRDRRRRSRARHRDARRGRTGRLLRRRCGADRRVRRRASALAARGRPGPALHGRRRSSVWGACSSATRRRRPAADGRRSPSPRASRIPGAWSMPARAPATSARRRPSMSCTVAPSPGPARAAPSATLPYVLEYLARSEAVDGRYASAAAHAAEGLRLARGDGAAELGLPPARLAGADHRDPGPRAGVPRLRRRGTRAGDGTGARLPSGARRVGDRAPRSRAGTAGTGAGAARAAGGGGPRQQPPVREARLRSRARRGRGRTNQPGTAQAALLVFERFARDDRAAVGTRDGGPVPRAALRRRGRRARTSSRRCAGTARALRPFDRARTELAFGEYLRRDGRRTTARHAPALGPRRVRAAGRGAWAERARAELRASGETARKRTSQRHRSAHAAGASDHPARGRGRDQQGGRRAAVPQPAHDRLPPAQGLHQARHLVAQRARPRKPRGRPQRRAGAREPARA